MCPTDIIILLYVNIVLYHFVVSMSAMHFYQCLFISFILVKINFQQFLLLPFVISLSNTTVLMLISFSCYFSSGEKLVAVHNLPEKFRKLCLRYVVSSLNTLSSFWVIVGRFYCIIGLYSVYVMIDAIVS